MAWLGKIEIEKLRTSGLLLQNILAKLYKNL